jgi:YVTN family beta-propeller protein
MVSINASGLTAVGSILRAAAVCAGVLLAIDASQSARATDAPVSGSGFGTALLPTGQTITPTAAPGAVFSRLPTGLRADGTADANGAVTTALSPDGTALVVITSGYNTYFYDTSANPITHVVLDPLTGQPSQVSTINAESIFVFDVRGNVPVLKQRIEQPDTYHGLAWDPAGQRFYVSAGNDDRIYIYKAAVPEDVAADATFVPDAPFILLGHNGGQKRPLPIYDGGIFSGTPLAPLLTVTGLGPTSALAAGLSVSPGGELLAVANLQNDSVTLVNTSTRKPVREVHFFTPGGTQAIGEMPYWTSIAVNAVGGPSTVFVSSQRDGQVLAVNAITGAFQVIPVGGEPGRMLLSADGARLYVANPDLDEIEEIDANGNQLLRRISVARAGDTYRGSSPNALALSPDGATLYVTLGGENALAVIDLHGGKVRGRIPTGWAPSSVTVSADGTTLFITNTKSNAGPSNYMISLVNDGEIVPPDGVDGYVLGLEKAGLLTLPVPDQPVLDQLSAQVDANNGFANRGAKDPMMAFLHEHIKHVIYVLKENRTYDQVLGDLPQGNGDPSYVEFPQPVTPNHHGLAERFALLDNFYDAGDVSGDGWNWTFQGHANDYTNKTVPVGYGNASVYGNSGLAGSTLPFDWNGDPRNIGVALPDSTTGTPSQATVRITTLLDPSLRSAIEPGTKDITASAGADDDARGSPETGGYLWDSVLRAGKTLRHYGVYTEEDYYFNGSPVYLPIVRDAFAQQALQSVPVRPALIGLTDPWSRGWDLDTPDQYRFEEWQREFDDYIATKSFPDFELVLFMMDHFGNFSTNVAHLNTPTRQIASNDYAIGQLADAVSHSPYWKDTAIFVLEDDSQDGPDHVDSHRSVVQVISPYTRPGAVIHTNYNTVNVMRTIEEILGVKPLGMNDANALPMSDVFTTTPDLTPYTAIVPGVLCKKPVDPTLVPNCANPASPKTLALDEPHDGDWWAAETAGFDFHHPDRVDPRRFNEILWRGLMGSAPYPGAKTAFTKPETDEDR